jgi:hypothetical protein
MKKDTTILLIAFGKKGYAYAAYNLAKSIKIHSPQSNIHIAHDGCLSVLNDLSVFDSFHVIDDNLKIGINGKICPAKVKLSMYGFLPTKYKKVLYLDVDAICLKPIDDLINELEGKELSTKVFGKGGINDKIEYSLWASNETIWNKAELKTDSVLCGINTSYIYFERNKATENVFKQALEMYNKFEIKDLLITWSGTMPDELILSSTLAKLDVIPHSVDMIYFGNKLNITTQKELIEKHYFLAMYGPAGARALTRQRYVEWYDGWVKSFGGYASKNIMKDKHLTNFVK